MLLLYPILCTNIELLKYICIEKYVYLEYSILNFMKNKHLLYYNNNYSIIHKAAFNNYVKKWSVLTPLPVFNFQIIILKLVFFGNFLHTKHIYYVVHHNFFADSKSVKKSAEYNRKIKARGFTKMF